LSSYRIALVAITPLDGPNYQGMTGEFWVTDAHHGSFALNAEKRLYNTSGSVMSIPAINMGIWRDIYVALGDPLPGDRFGVRLYYKPFIRWIWFGGLLMVLGGVLSLPGRNSAKSSVP
jgi:cytochrome c-type biogenesis protein CcmF